MDTETSQIDPKRKEPKRATQRFQNHWFPMCFRAVLYGGGGDGGGGALPPFPYTPFGFAKIRKSYQFGVVFTTVLGWFPIISVKPKGGTWNWQPGQGGVVLYRAPKMSPGTSLNLGQIELHMLLLKGFLQEAKKVSGASAISVQTVVLESLCRIYFQIF